jgi:hypothetical protein
LNFLYLIRQPFNDRAQLGEACAYADPYGFHHLRLAELRKQIRDSYVMVGIAAWEQQCTHVITCTQYIYMYLCRYMYL